MEAAPKGSSGTGMRIADALFCGFGATCLCAIVASWFIGFTGRLEDSVPLALFPAYFILAGFVASLLFIRRCGKPSRLEKILLLPGWYPLILAVYVLAIQTIFGGLPDQPWHRFLSVWGVMALWFVSSLAFSAIGVFAGAGLSDPPERILFFKKSLKVGLVVAMTGSAFVIAFHYVLPKHISRGELSYLRAADSIHIQGNTLAEALPKGAPMPSLYLHQLVLKNKGDVPLENVSVRLHFFGGSKDLDTFKICDVQHEVAPEPGFGKVDDGEEQGGRHVFGYSLLRPGDSDTITFFTNCDIRYTLRASANGSRISMNWLYDRGLVEPVIWAFLWAFLGAVLGSAFFWMKATAPSQEGVSPAEPCKDVEMALNTGETPAP